jgi:short-subunit dehydrogenase
MPKFPHPQRIFITGASSGIGYALALEYAAPGIKLGLLARRGELLEELAQQCRARGAEAITFATDVCDRAAIMAAADRFLSWAGGIDLVIANAGGGLLENGVIDPDVLDRTLRLNVSGVAHTLMPFIPAMRASGRGQLAAVASLSGYLGTGVGASYSASKAAVINLMQSLRLGLLGSSIEVTTISPGFIRTPLTENNPNRPWLVEVDDAARRIRRGLAQGRSTITFPWQLATLVRVLSLLPAPLIEFVAKRWQRKPAPSHGPG